MFRGYFSLMVPTLSRQIPTTLWILRKKGLKDSRDLVVAYSREFVFALRFRSEMQLTKCWSDKRDRI